MPKPARAKRQTTTSNTYRFFVDAPFDSEVITLDDPQFAHQISNVLRLQPGDEVVLLDNHGWQYTVALAELGRGRISATMRERTRASGEPHTQITMFLALVRPERFEWALQKGTELGVSAFVPLLCARSNAADASERKHERWSRIVREAAEQCRRGKIPALHATQSFEDACAAAETHDQALLLWEGDNAQPLRALLRAGSPPFPERIAVLSGPEGGLSDDERAVATQHGIVAVTLGPRTLRAETAPLAAATAILYERGDMD